MVDAVTDALPGPEPARLCQPSLEPWEQWDVPDDLDTPAVVVDAERLDANIAWMAGVAAGSGVDLRPHIKTHKGLAIARRQVQAGAVGLTTATLGEAETFARAGFTDLFVAYPVWVSSSKSNRLRAVSAEVERLRIGIDSVLGAQHLGRAAAGLDTIEVVVEVDSGDARSGVTSTDEAVLVGRAAQDAGLRVVGAFTHGGHGYRGADARHSAAADEAQVLQDVSAALAQEGLGHHVLSAGSTPTSVDATRGVATEQRPGTYVFGDAVQVRLGAMTTGQVALRVVATVVSRSRDHVIVDAGAKVLTKDSPALLKGHGTIVGYPHAEISRVYDHHGVITSEAAGALPRLGEVLNIVPNHVCPVVDLADELLVINGGLNTTRWRVDARGRNT